MVHVGIVGFSSARVEKRRQLERRCAGGVAGAAIRDAMATRGNIVGWRWQRKVEKAEGREAEVTCRGGTSVVRWTSVL